jgi:hypothetical protein
MTIAESLGVLMDNPPLESIIDELCLEITRVTLKRNRWRGYATSIGPYRNFSGAIRKLNVALGYAEYAIQSGDRKLIEEAMRDMVSFHDFD